nr:M17 family metallopeptidase [Mycoplasmopsis lipofaciens]
MNKYYLTERDNKILLKAFFKNRSNKEYENVIDQINCKKGSFTNFFDKQEALFFLKKEYETYDELVELIDTYIVNSKREYQIDLESFVTNKINIHDVLKAFTSRIIFHSHILFNRKKEKQNKIVFSFLLRDETLKNEFLKYEIIANNRNKCRDLQVMPENFCNSEKLADFIVDDFKNIDNLKVSVLDKKQIEKLKMGLLLSVNKGSTFEPRVVVIEYNGNPNSKDKIVYVGKGITFDTGGVNTKGYHMEGMKYDMSGSVIIAYALKSMAQLKIQKNVAAIMMITDNRLDGDASLPENVYESMSGLTVEVVDTDAEGRLVLADGLYYGAKVLNATTLVDVATLTGTMLTALGTSYSGIYSTSDKNWKIFEEAG